MFVDETSVTVHGGEGGNGCVSFRREKYVPRGGPNGGDGGNGGSVILEASHDEATLLAFRHRRVYRAASGRHGEGSNKTGRSGEDLVLKVPVGTVVKDEAGVRILTDLSADGQRYTAAAGGRGGRGNARFAGATHQTPTRADPGQLGDSAILRLELKLLADVGLLGFPNAGKSTLISRLSAARPKIADYPFTTLEPHLGVVDCGEFRSFVMADIPGLIEGAHRGTGLGHRFLRHIERCRLLLHLVDPTQPDRDPIDGIRTLNQELAAHSAELAVKPQILVLTKADAVQDPASVQALRRFAEDRGQLCLTVSAVTGQGLQQAVRSIATYLDGLVSCG